MNIDITDESSLPKAADELISYGSGLNIWLFEGELGAGKTTLIKAICNRLGVVDEVVSPTFSIINEYENQEGIPLYHFDFYRISSLEEADRLALDDYFYSGNLCLIEWPEKITPLIPDQYLKINIKFMGQNRCLDLARYVSEDPGN